MDENNSIAVKSYVDDIFRYLDTYETNYAQFETAAFLQTYNGIIAVFQALRQQRDQAVEVDQYFLNRIKSAPLTSSDLRQLVVQVIITFFEVETDIDGRSNKSFTYCRGLRAVKQDVPYFETHLIPLLFREGSLNGNFKLNAFLLKEIARYLNTYGKQIDIGLKPEAFDAMTEPVQFLQLSRRRLQLGEGLLEDRTSLEFHLHRVDKFTKISQGSPTALLYLKEWDYIQKTSFWSRVKAFLGEFGGKLKGVFSSSRYTRLVLSQRNAAYLFYSVIIVLFLFLAVWVPMTWSDHSADKLQQMQQKVEKLQGTR